MKTYIEESLCTPIVGEYDVIIAGGGPAGIGAAIAAGRNGMKTLLVERYGFLGGIWTAGLVNPFFDTENKGGIVLELVNRLKELNAWGGWEGICFDYEVIKTVLDDMVTRAGVDILFQSVVAGAVVQDKRVKGVFVQNKSGREAYLAQVVIDCTGDGDVSALAGAEFEIGRKEDGLVQPMTLMFRLGNVSYLQETRDDLYELIAEAVKKNNLEYKITYKHPYLLMLPGQNSAVAQMIHIKGLSGINARDLSKAYIQARKEVMEAFGLFKNHIPQFKSITLEQTAAQIGVREARRIMGEYVITLEDIMEGKRFEDGITLCSFPVDIHQPDKDGQDTAFPKPYHVPYRSLVPRSMEGLLVAGRCISGTHEAHASYRVTGNCMAMGEAAGVAASIAVKDHVTLRKVDTCKLIDILLKQHRIRLR